MEKRRDRQKSTWLMLSRVQLFYSTFCTGSASHPANMTPKSYAGVAKKDPIGCWCCDSPESLKV